MTARKWHILPMWKKRVQGFITYQYAAFQALLHPIEVDLAMRDVLNEQFKTGASK